MSTELIAYVSQYGYLAVFSLVLLYELGVPNPFQQELLLIMSGVLASQGTLDLGAVFLVAVSADVIGTSVLYTLFYFLGHTILEKKSRWLPFKKEQYEKMVAFLSRRGRGGIFLWRLIPYVRGYASVGAGLLQVPPRIYFPMVAASAFVASGG
ncbi:MAG TPA: VTT domain-containing protein, partial [Patescibacteria group bacterium]|nr:VTT domain-containing protein [Patescibacteria group bacterium]